MAEEKISIVIDTQPPRIEVLSRQHNVERSGSGLVIYRLFEPDLNSGVQVGDRFFPGHTGLFDQTDIHAAFFALDHTQAPGPGYGSLPKMKRGMPLKKGFIIIFGIEGSNRMC